MGQPEETPGFIEEALRHRQVTEPTEDGVAKVLEPDATEPPATVEPAATGAAAPQAALEPEPVAPVAPFSQWAVADRALIDEALKKSGLIWLQTGARPGGQGYWHVWLGDAIYLLTGGSEQPDGGVDAGEVVTVVVRSKETTARLLSFEATVSDLLPADADWGAATTALASARLNLHDAAGAPDRWASDRDSRLIRLIPSAPDGERPGAYSTDSHRAAPRPTAATTAGPKPRVLHRRHGSGRPLS